MEANFRTLDQTMTVEAIASIKTKRMANKLRLDVEGKQNRKLQRKQFGKEQEKQAEICRMAMKRERQHRTRDEQLLSQKEVPGILECVSLFYDIHKLRMVKKDSTPKVENVPPTSGLLKEVPVVPPQLETLMPPPKCIKYNRYRQEKFLKGQQEFGINPQGSHMEPEKPSYSGSKSKGKVTKKLMPAPTTDFTKMANKVKRHVKTYSRMPIIVVPDAKTSLVNMSNVKQLLQEMRYVPVEQARRQALTDGQHADDIIIEHRFQGQLVKYRVIDNIVRLTAEEWARVAAVFAMGPHWQFKGWPMGGDPARIFHEVCAFHLYFKNSPVCKELRNLQVNLLALSPNERHMDCGILTEFWNKLDRHMAVRIRQFAFIK
ncbi:parafibromin [Drosophila eugracilis]|uniref:parafibromin n=1 Tax=Drosophila eugracilis TaxID=29029 RepID=UPI0007E78587|nr:parafibromin [Drosophila eugracilis]